MRFRVSSSRRDDVACVNGCGAEVADPADAVRDVDDDVSASDHLI